MNSESEEFLGIKDPIPEATDSDESGLLPIRVIVTALLAIPALLSVFPLAVLTAIGQGDPTRSPRESGILAFAFSLAFIGFTFASIWTSSRSLLVIASALWIPVGAACVIVATKIPPLWFLMVPPVVWVLFALVAWPVYRNGRAETPPEPPRDKEIENGREFGP